MSWIRQLSPLFAFLVVAPAFGADVKTPVGRSTNDRLTLDTLTAIHNRGAALFNGGDPAGCYRLFQGALIAVRPVLPEDVHEVVDAALAEAERDSSPSRRALLLHDVIEAVRKSVHKTAGPPPIPLGLPRKLSSDGEPLKAPDLAAKPSAAEPSRAPEKIELPMKPLEIELPSPMPPAKPNPVKPTGNPPPPVIEPMPDPTPPPIIIPTPTTDKKK